MKAVTDPARRNRLLGVGLSGTGKSTFLVALYHVVESGELPGTLRLKKGTLFEADREYIQKQRERWLDCKPVERNKVDAKDPIRLTLLDEQTGATVLLDLPDLSGETFRMQVEERAMPASFSAHLEASDGLLLFVNPATLIEPTPIAEAASALDDDRPDPEVGTPDSQRPDGPAADLLPLASAEPAPEAETTDDGTERTVHFPPAKCCTATKLVELLQFAATRFRVTPMPVAVVISAFDLLQNTPYHDDPLGYFASRLALVDQYLRANAHVFTYSVFGVSAQGVEYDNNEAIVAQVAARGAAANKIRIVPEPPTNSHDITYIVRWLAGESAR